MLISVVAILSFLIKPVLAFALGQAVAPYEVTLINPTGTFESGADIEVGVVLRNTSQTPLKLAAVAPDTAELNYRVDVRDASGKKVVMSQYYKKIASTFGFSGKSIVLRPGQEEEDDLSISKLYNLETPGTYTIQVTRIGDFRPAAQTVVKSNIVSFTVVPHSTADGAATRPSKPRFSINVASKGNQYTFVSGDRLLFQVALTNTSGHDIQLQQSRDKKAELDFAVQISHVNGDLVNPTSYGESLDQVRTSMPASSWTTISLPAGRSIVEDVAVGELYQLDPGRYVLRVTRKDADVAGLKRQNVESSLTFTIVP